MLVAVLCLSLAMILGVLWYAGLKKRRQSAIDALKLIHQKIDLRLDVLHAMSAETRASWSDAFQKRFNTLTQLEVQSQWDESDIDNLDATIQVWQTLDSELTDFIAVLDDALLSKEKRQLQTQLAQDIEQVQGFYNQTVKELNSGVSFIPTVVVSKVINIEPLPTFTPQTV